MYDCQLAENEVAVLVSGEKIDYSSDPAMVSIYNFQMTNLRPVHVLLPKLNFCTAYDPHDFNGQTKDSCFPHTDE